MNKSQFRNLDKPLAWAGVGLAQACSAFLLFGALPWRNVCSLRGRTPATRRPHIPQGGTPDATLPQTHRYDYSVIGRAKGTLMAARKTDCVFCATHQHEVYAYRRHRLGSGKKVEPQQQKRAQILWREYGNRSAWRCSTCSSMRKARRTTSIHAL